MFELKRPKIKLSAKLEKFFLFAYGIMNWDVFWEEKLLWNWGDGMEVNGFLEKIENFNF